MYVGVCVLFSDKLACSIPDELFDAAANQAVATVNFSRNQLTSIPSRYRSAHTHTHTWSLCDWRRFILCAVNRLLDFHSSLADINLGFNQLTCCSPEIGKLLQLMHIDLRYTCTHTVGFVSAWILLGLCWDCGKTLHQIYICLIGVEYLFYKNWFTRLSKASK